MPLARKRAAAALLLALLPVSAGAADDASLTRMALCRDSWLDWQKAGDPRLQKFAEQFRAGFAPHGNDPYVVPKAPVTIAGFRVLQLYPGSVGMGVGFSVLVDAPFDAVRRRVEHSAGKPLKDCETGDGMRSCAVQLAERRTLMVLTQDPPKNASTLLGCYYYYEK
ncbi:MAG: hypothetical protein WDN08_16290 [Rhizomicrobium sp.]